MNTKLGRCECEDTDCVLLAPGKGAKTDHTSFKSWRCQRDAVRMVTVLRDPRKAERIIADVRGHLRADDYKQVPMCAACTDFYEMKGD